MIQKGFIDTIKVTKCYDPYYCNWKSYTSEYLFFSPPSLPLVFRQISAMQ